MAGAWFIHWLVWPMHSVAGAWFIRNPRRCIIKRPHLCNVVSSLTDTRNKTLLVKNSDKPVTVTINSNK